MMGNGIIPAFAVGIVDPGKGAAKIELPQPAPSMPGAHLRWTSSHKMPWETMGREASFECQAHSVLYSTVSPEMISVVAFPPRIGGRLPGVSVLS